jgi:peptidyl-tRNA hydrolase, PTH1 family
MAIDRSPNLQPPASSLRLIVGLGNPGSEYDVTRHNVGFLAVDALAGFFKTGAWKNKFKGLLTSCGDPALLFLKPQTYMNLSGESVGEALRFHKLIPAQVIVFQDELDLEPGQVKIKQGGGSGGHNGIKSIDAHIGQNYWRVRIGIGHPGIKGEAVTNHVLDRFAKADKLWLDPLLEILASEFHVMLNGKPNDYQSRIARKMNASNQ